MNRNPPRVISRGEYPVSPPPVPSRGVETILIAPEFERASLRHPCRSRAQVLGGIRSESVDDTMAPGRKANESSTRMYVCMYVCMVITYSNGVDQPGKVVNPARGQLNRDNEHRSISLSPFAPENLVSRDGFGSPVPRQPAHPHTQAESSTRYQISNGTLS